MEYKYIDDINIEDVDLPESDKINSFLLKNNYADIVKGLDFLASDAQFLYIHGFLGTGKRQFINYLTDFLQKDVIKLEYHCKQSTVCDDILLSFIDVIEKNTLSKAITHTAKITTLAVKFQQYVSSIKKPFIVVLHSFDDIQKANNQLVVDVVANVLSNPNVKVILSTRAMIQDVLGERKADKKIMLKALSKTIFQKFINVHNINCTDESINDFYKYSRGYYYYTALAVKIIQAMNISLNDFLSKYTMSGMSFDSYLGLTYVNLIPNTIHNFFWFLRCVRHGISVNALAVLGLYDEFSIKYLKDNLMAYQSGEILFVQDYFQQDIDISIPAKVEIKLHKYIINIYEKELKESLQTRTILISRQAMRAEIEYHNKRIYELENNINPNAVQENTNEKSTEVKKEQVSDSVENNDINNKMNSAKKLAGDKKYTEAIEAYLKIIEEFNLTPNVLAEIRIELGRLYFTVNDYAKSQHYYELAESYYVKNEEFINLNYLNYELTGLYFAMYKIERAIETIKKVIYSVDTPQSLMVDACVRLGNIYTDTEKYEEAYKYYLKALESIDSNTPENTKAELYFKLALVCDEKEDDKDAFEYYNKCIQTGGEKSFKALAYSNLGACYFENGNLSDAQDCFLKAYQIEKNNNNYEGIYYTALHLAKICMQNNHEQAGSYLIEAKQCAEFINEDYYILEATIALGDYYYDQINMKKKALIEYLSARKIAQNFGNIVDIDKIEERINDMKLRMDKSEFDSLEQKYE